MTAFDVAVVGMGPAGAAAAQVLAAAGRSVVLLGKPADPRRRVGEVLTPAIGPLLVQLGIWERFVACDPRPVHAIWSAWGGRAESEVALAASSRRTSSPVRTAPPGGWIVSGSTS